jgi:hypothetical protein
MTSFKEMKGAPKLRSRRPAGNAGSATGRESYGDGVLVVVRARESRVHGEGGQVIGSPKWRGTREAQRRNHPGDHPRKR